MLEPITEADMVAPYLSSLNLRNYRSIGPESVRMSVPTDQPLVLIGENNAGKSNLSRAVELLFGERWASTYSPEDHEFYGRDRREVTIQIRADVGNFSCSYCNGQLASIVWTFDDSRDGDPQEYRQKCENENCAKNFVARATKTKLMAILVNAERSLTYQLSYSSKYTLLSKLMQRFHQELVRDEDRREVLADIFGSLIEQFQGVSQFAQFKELLTSSTALLGQNLPYALEIDFSAYDPSNFFRSLRVQPCLSGETRTFDELGTGQRQILGIAFAYAYARSFGASEGLVLVVDEPESNLHPLAQQWLARQLRELVTPGLQIVLATHSPHFVDLARPAGLALVRRSHQPDGPTTVQQHDPTGFVKQLVLRGAPSDRTTVDSVEDFYAAASTVETVSGLFARACVLVEGRSEALALPELLRLVGFECLKAGIAVVSADGLTNIAKWIRLYESYGIPTYAVFDTDSNKKASEAEWSTRAHKDILGAFFLDADEYLPVSSDPIFVCDRFAALTPDFEGAMRALGGQAWSLAEQAGSQLVGGGKASKPLVARFVARKLRREDVDPRLLDALEEVARQLDLLVARQNLM